jgi:hypothetical protein
MAKFKVKGIDRDFDTCECCGKTNLKKTVVLARLDLDGNEMDVVRYGVDCAARATLIRRSHKAMDAFAENVQAESEKATAQIIHAVCEGIPGVTWVVESVSSQGDCRQLCLATGTRSAIRDWAEKMYPNNVIDVRKAI